MESSATVWANAQWASVELGDRRLTARAIEVGRRMAAHPEASLPNQMGSRCLLKGAYRLLNHPEVTLAALAAPHCGETRAAAGRQRIVLMVEDTTELDYTRHRNSKTGLGPIGDGRGTGLLLHSALAVTPETRQVLGLAHVQAVLRVSTPTQPRRKWARSPEGLVWETSAAAVGQPPLGVTWVHVGDRGSDVFTYMAACVETGKGFLLRVRLNRLLTWEAGSPEAQQPEARALLDYVRSLALDPTSRYEIDVPTHGKREARKAQMEMGWVRVTISSPTQAPSIVRQHQPIIAWALRTVEIDPPPGVDRLEWILLTSLPITSSADAQSAIDWYSCRWLCEDYHQCLKTGCQIENSQLDNGADIQRLLGFAAPIAVRLLQLRQVTRQSPAALAVEIVEPLMVQTLARLQQLDSTSITIREFWRQVAALGGHQGRRRDGPPGWRTLWRGWRYLADLTEGARLFATYNTT